MKLCHLKHFSSSKDACISQDEKVLLHKQAIFSTFSDKIAADSLHFVIYCFKFRFLRSANTNIRSAIGAPLRIVKLERTWSATPNSYGARVTNSRIDIGIFISFLCSGFLDFLENFAF